MYNNFYLKPNTDERIWVQNEAAAEAYLVAPNSFVRMWDSNAPKFYERTTDASGRPMPLKAFKYEQIPTNNELNDPSNTIGYQEQINAIIGRLNALEEEMRHDAESHANATAV